MNATRHIVTTVNMHNLDSDPGFLATRWTLGLVPADEREEVRRFLVTSGLELGEDGRWRRIRRPDPEPIAGVIVVK